MFHMVWSRYYEDEMTPTENMLQLTQHVYFGLEINTTILIVSHFIGFDVDC